MDVGLQVRLREQVSTIVPGGTSDISEAIAGQDQAVQQLKNNLTQIAMVRETWVGWAMWCSWLCAIEA